MPEIEIKQATGEDRARLHKIHMQMAPLVHILFGEDARYIGVIVTNIDNPIQTDFKTFTNMTPRDMENAVLDLAMTIIEKRDAEEAQQGATEQ